MPNALARVAGSDAPRRGPSRADIDPALDWLGAGVEAVADVADGAAQPNQAWGCRSRLYLMSVDKGSRPSIQSEW